MSDFRKRIEELFDKFKPGGEYHGKKVKDLSTEDKKVLSDLAAQYTQVKMAGLSYEEVVQSYVDQADTIKREKVFYEHELDYLNETINLQDSMADTLKHQIATLASRELDEAEKEELEQKRAFYLELKKASKTNKQIQAGFEKAQAATEGMLAATLGITKSYNFSKAGIKGGIKGFGKGLIKSFHPMNVIAAVMKRVKEQLVAMDKARATLFRSTGLSGFTDQLADIGQDLRGAYGPRASAVAGELTAEAQRTMKSFNEMRADGSATKIIIAAGKFQKLGVSASATFELNKYFNANMDYTADQQTGVLMQLHAQAKEMGRPPEEVFREMAESVPLYSRYGDQFPTIFRGISLAARKTNLSISDLQSLTEGLDSTEDAMKKAAKVNSLLGGNYLNGQELLAADPGDKVKLIARAYQRAEAATGGIHPRVLRSVYQEFGMDASSFKKMAGGEFSKFEKELADTPKPSSVASIDKDIQKTLDAKDKIGNRLDYLVGHLSKWLAKIPVLRKAVNFITNNIEYFAIAATGLSLLLSAKKMSIGTPMRPKYVSGMGGPGSGDGTGDGTGDGKKKKKKKKKKKGKRGKAGKGSGYYNAKTNRFHDPSGKMISNKEAAGRGLDKGSTKKASRKTSGKKRRRRRVRMRGRRRGLGGMLGGCPGMDQAATSNMRKLKDAGTKMRARGAAMVNAMRTRVGGVVKGLQGAVDSLKGRMSSLSSSLASAKRSAGGFFSRMAAGAKSLKDRGAAALSRAKQAVVSKASQAGSAIRSGAQRAGSAITKRAKQAKTAVSELGTRAMTAIKSLSPPKQLQKFLKKVPVEKIGKLFKSVGLLNVLFSIGTVASILMSDAPKKEKAKQLIIAGSGAIGAGIGLVAGSLLGPLGALIGSIGGSFLGEFVGSQKIVQDALIPIFTPLMPAGSEAKVAIAAAKKNKRPLPTEPIQSTKVDDAVTPMSTAPAVQASFETSMGDDVLLKKLHMLKKNLEDLHSKGNRVSLTVGNNRIASATVG